MQIFCAAVTFCTALAVLIEIRKGPWFVSRVIIAIIAVSIAIMIVQTGIILRWFDTHVMNAVGTFFFCFYTFLDIEIYWTFASRYWETSFHITTYLKRQAAETEEERLKLAEKQKRHQKQSRIWKSGFHCLLKSNARILHNRRAHATTHGTSMSGLDWNWSMFSPRHSRMDSTFANRRSVVARPACHACTSDISNCGPAQLRHSIKSHTHGESSCATAKSRKKLTDNTTDKMLF